MKRGRRINNIPKEQIEAEKLYLRGYSKDTIARTVGVSLMTIYRWAEKDGWELAYKRKYGEDLSKITDEIERIEFMCLHRTPKVNTPKIVKN